MNNLFRNFSIFLLLVMPTSILIINNDGGSMLVHAVEEDAAEGEEPADVEEDSATVEDETDAADAAATQETLDEAAKQTADREKEEAEAEVPQLKPSPDADTHVLFVKPTGLDLPAGKQVRLIVGFSNKGVKDFTVDTMEASFRYPQDYTYFIQNFTGVRFDRVVEPQRQASFEYRFTPSENFNARPFGLVINLNYKDQDSNYFQDAVFNDTVNIVENDEGLDGETFFMYVFLAALGVLMLVGAQQLLVTYGKKRLPKLRSAPVETGTQNNKSGIDYDYIPKEALEAANRSPGRSPKLSPRQRRANRQKGSAED